MLLKWARWLPYWIVAKLMTRTYSADGHGILKLGKDYKVTYFRLGEGEFLVYSNELYKKMQQKKQIKSDRKRQKQIDKINKTLDSNFSLKQELKEQFEYETKCESEDY